MLNSAQDPVPAAPPALLHPGGPSRAVLMMVDPRRLFLYWVIDEVAEAQRTARPGPAELRLERSDDGVLYHETARLEFDFRAPHWYIPNEALDCTVRVRLGASTCGSGKSTLPIERLSTKVGRDDPS